MLEAWFNFGILLLVQLFVFVAFALYERKLSNIWRILGKGILVGIPFGLLFDLVLGKLLGLSTYALGFELYFLIPNAALSYGIFAATILLLNQQRRIYFCIATISITALYEVANLYLRVWAWHFPVPILLFPVILAIGYVAGAILVVKTDQQLKLKRL